LPSKAGARATVTPLARTTTDSTGRFAIRLPASSDPSLTTTRSGGALNLHVIAFYPGGVAQWFYSLPSAKRAVAFQPTAKLVLHHAPETLQTASPAAPTEPDACTTQVVRVIAQVPVVMGFKESGDAHLKYATFEYDNSDSLTLGAGISYSSDSGGFSQDGSTTQTAGGSTTYPNMVGAGNNVLLGDGIYDDTYWVCPEVHGGLQFWELTQHDVDSDFGTPGASAIPIGKCLVTHPDTTLSYTQGTQQTFTSGVSLAAKGYGVNLSSQDGWSASATLTYAFASSSAPICGMADYPGSPDYVGIIGVH
jgi:hypothetical protein